MSKDNTIKQAKIRGVRSLSEEDMNRDQYGQAVLYYFDKNKCSEISRLSTRGYVNRAIPDNIIFGRVNYRENYFSMNASGLRVTDIFDVSCEFSNEDRELFGFRKKPELLERIDRAAEACGMSRAVFMRVAVHDAVANDDIVPASSGKKSQRSQSVALLKSDLERLEQAAKQAGTMKTKCFFHAMERAIEKVEAELSGIHHRPSLAHGVK